MKLIQEQNVYDIPYVSMHLQNDDITPGCSVAASLLVVTRLKDNWWPLERFRAVGAGPAGPAAAGSIFCQLTRAKISYELRRVVQLLL